MAYKFAVITISDTCYASPTKDISGPCLQHLIKQHFPTNATKIITDILPDDCEMITKHLRVLINNAINVIITTGGTGFGMRDVTPEATKPLITRPCPQLTMAMFHRMFTKSKFAALSRGLCGIAENTLILNFPGSEKAVTECFNAVVDFLPHALHLLTNNLDVVTNEHKMIQNVNNKNLTTKQHTCGHKTNDKTNETTTTTTTIDNSCRNSKFPMTPVNEALKIIFENMKRNEMDALSALVSPIDIPASRASIKDGYALKSSGFSGIKKVIGIVAAGDNINMHALLEDECFKINTGAIVPKYCDCIIQVEDTKLLETKPNGNEHLVEIQIEPKENLDIRPIGCDLQKGAKLFPLPDHSMVVIESLLASVGMKMPAHKLKIAILSTGSELINEQQQMAHAGKTFDSNTKMLEKLLEYFGFQCQQKAVAADNIEETKKIISELYENVNIIISTGGVSMGNRDYIKPVLMQLGFDIKFGRVNMKPGKPTVFAVKNSNIFFGLPGNPVSAFVTFHLFVLPALRWRTDWIREKCTLAVLRVTLQNEEILLDMRPEYMCASVTAKNGALYAFVNGIQRSSRLQSIVGADVLIHLPGWTKEKPTAVKGDVFEASILRYDFISKYE